MEDYNKLLDRFDNALIEKELLNDNLKAEQLSNLEKTKEIKELKNSLRLKNKTYKIYTQKIQGLRELVDDKRNEIVELKEEISKLHEMNWNLSKLLNKETKKELQELHKYLDELNNK